MQEEILEAFRNPFFLVYIASVLSFCVVGSAQITDAVQVELQAFRLQQVDVGGSVYGSRSTRVAYEAVSLDSQALRKSTVVEWMSLVGRDLDALLSSSAGALLIVIPRALDQLTTEEQKSFVGLERALLSARTDVAVYVVPENEHTSTVLHDAKASSASASSVVSTLASPATLLSSVASVPSTPLSYQPQNVLARLSCGDRSAPTIAFVAHYDSHSAFPGLSAGADSNGSGVVALLELLAILKKFYDKPSTRPPFNLVFVWTAAGKLNFQGARHFSEQWVDKNSDSKLELVVCLEGLANPGSLHMHVAKAPSEGSAADRLLTRLRSTQDVELSTKKININQPLAWEHERFNMKRLPAVTLSRYSSHDVHQRQSLLDTVSAMDNQNLHSAIRTLAEAVLGYLLNLSPGVAKDLRVEADQAMLSKEAVDSERISFFISQLASVPRPVASPDATKAAAASISSSASAYARVSYQSVQLSEVSVWGGVHDTIVAERVRPAAFELFVATGVVAYLMLFYQFATRAHSTMEGTVRALKRAA